MSAAHLGELAATARNALAEVPAADRLKPDTEEEYDEEERAQNLARLHNWVTTWGDQARIVRYVP